MYSPRDLFKYSEFRGLLNADFQEALANCYDQAVLDRINEGPNLLSASASHSPRLASGLEGANLSTDSVYFHQKDSVITTTNKSRKNIHPNAKIF